MNGKKRAKPGVNAGALRAMGKSNKVVLRVLSYVMNVLLTLLLIGLITGIIVGTVFAIYINQYLDLEIDPSTIVTINRDSTTRIYYMQYDSIEDRINREGTPVEIEDQRLYAKENTIAVSYSQIPKNLRNAFIAIEDKRFLKHNGVDWITTVKSVFKYFTGGAGGGSTITQQLIKNVTGESDVTIQRKVQEIFRAINLEKVKSKEEILEAYMNIVYLGNGCYGVQSAANFYFGKDVSELTLVECASLAAIVKNPSQFDPLYHDEDFMSTNAAGEQILKHGNKYRRWTVLDEMKNNGMINETECVSAQNEELVLHVGSEDDRQIATSGLKIYNWYTEAMLSQLSDDLMEKYGVDVTTAWNMILYQGYKIYIPMDPEVQDTLELVYENDSEYFPQTGAGLQPQSAMVICDPYTGDVLGTVGGRGEKTMNRGTDRATFSKRPPGSSIKPLSVYGPALDAGLITYGSIIDDTPVYFNKQVISPATATTKEVASYTPYPMNLPTIYRGLTTIHSGVTRSVNTIAMKTLQLLTIDRSFDFMKNKLHFDSLVESYTKSNGETITDKGLAALALGQPNYGVTLLEMTSAYCIFQNNGVYNSPNLYLYVTDADGNVIIENVEESEIVISDNSASIMTVMLQEVMNQGTGVGCTLRYDVNVAGKTGTTTSDFDRYFMGYTPYYVGGVWTGYDIPQSLSSFGENPSLVVWDKVMTILHKKYIDAAANGGEALKKFELSPGVVTATYCRDSGKLCTDACALDPRGNRAEVGYFTRDTIPTEYCETHVTVLRDNEKNLIASPNCNPENCSTVSLIRVEDRSFPMEIYVEDAQYVYREMSEDIRPGGWWGSPFFVHLLDEGEYCGSSYVDTPYNAYCYFHCDYRKWGGNPPAEYSGYTPPGGDEPDDTTKSDETDETVDNPDETDDTGPGEITEDDVYGEDDDWLTH